MNDILLDENVDRRISVFLESKGFNVTNTDKEGLSSVKDREIISYSLKNSLIILTHDDDFLSLIKQQKDSPKVIYLPQRIRFREMKRRLEDLHQKISQSKSEEIYP